LLSICFESGCHHGPSLCCVITLTTVKAGSGVSVIRELCPSNTLAHPKALRPASRSVGFVQWIVDGMNVIGTRPDGWWENRRRAMIALVDQLERWASAEGNDLTVVFERPLSPPIRSSVIEIAHAPKAAADSADDEIVRLVRADDRPQDIRVVTSDRKLTDRVRAAGASTYPAHRFRDLIERLR
jgi:predicted RNA-binding protein with PIN domain